MSVQSSLRSHNDLRIGRKMATFQLLFQSKEQVVVRRSQIWRIELVNKTLCCKCPVTRGIIVQEREILGELLVEVSFKMSFNCTSREE